MYQRFRFYFVNVPYLLAACWLALYSFPAQSALLNLQQAPLTTQTTSVPPNVFLQIDDSGSMDYEFAMKSYFLNCAYDPNITGTFDGTNTCGLFYDGGVPVSYGNGGFREFSFIFWSTNCTGTNSVTGNNPSFNSIVNCPEAGTNEWRIFSNSLNGVYYTPNSTYVPWLADCSTSGSGNNVTTVACGNASFSSARKDPVSTLPGYSNLKNLAGSNYQIWIDDKGFTGDKPKRGSEVNVTGTTANPAPNGIIDLWDSHVRIVLNSTNVQVFSTTYAPSATGMNEVTTLRATLSGTACFNALGPTSLVTSIFNGTLAYGSTGASGCRTIADANQNFANWYQYYRTRMLVVKGVVAFIIDQFLNLNYGLNTINNRTFTAIGYAGSSTGTTGKTKNSNLLAAFMSVDPNGSTPLRSALSRVGDYYMNGYSTTSCCPSSTTTYPSPITNSCQQNYTILLTDGEWNLDDGFSIGDIDQDGQSNTLADVARKYYLQDLAPSLPDNVAPSAWDPATWQHMVTYTVGFSTGATLVDTDNDGWPNPVLGVNSVWGSNKTDDLWHAAFNGAGAFVNASSYDAVSNAMTGIFTNIAQRGSSASPVSQNSSVLSTTSQVFQSIFDTTGWVGDVLAFNISSTGTLSTTPIYSANCILTGGACTSPAGTFAGISPSNRVILTRDWAGANSGIAFTFPTSYTTYKSNTNMINFMKYAPYSVSTTTSSQITANQAYGSALLNYLRGVRTNEAANKGTYTFRDRKGLLGDIVSSSPIYVPAPYRNYPTNLESASYATFKANNSTRTPMLYVGANDGMLHAFNANTGSEVLAYIPGNRQIYSRLPELSQTTYPHYYFVNATPAEGDVFFNGAWHTILVTALGNGGQGLSMLDITNPTNFTQGNATSIYLSEFDDTNDVDMGYIQGTPIIAKVRTGTNQSKWAIIVNNGYNNSQADGYASTTGKAYLYILFIEDGIKYGWIADQTYIKIPVGTGSVATPNGLSTPYAIDVDGDYIVDQVYAGDIQGNMWRFNLTSTSPVNWKTGGSLLFTASFATAGDQPITAAPIVGRHPTGLNNGVIVYFGTGKFLEPVDNSGTGQVTQTFYGIWDKMAGATVAKNKLLQQTILGEVSVTTGTNPSTYRIVSNNAINWAAGSNQNLGWYMNLIESGASSNLGERVISAPLLRNGNVVFTTFIPNNSPCGGINSGWLMEVNAANGGQPNITPFDTNNDGIFNAFDYLKLSTTNGVVTSPAAGIQSVVGAAATPTVFLTPDKTKEIKVLTGSKGLGTVTENPGSSQTGRQNWRQLF